MKNVIYILTNPSFPDYIKIGYASDIEKRLKQLNRSETIPFAFRVYAIYKTNNKLTDKEVHRLIDSLNPNLRAIETFDGKERVKEFYAMTPEDAYNILDCIAKISGTEHCLKKMKPTGHEIADEEIAQEIRHKRPPFKFSECNIPFGSEIQYINDETIIAKVLDDRHILYNDETISLSALAKKLLNSEYDVQGTLYFKYNGQVLNDLRNNINHQDLEKGEH